MSMIFRSLFVIAAVAVVAGGATKAVFSSPKNTGLNVVTAGTLTLDLDASQLPIKMDNAYPGMKKSATFSVTNSGSLAGHLRIEPIAESVGGALCPFLTVSLKNLDNNDTLVSNARFAELATAISGNVALTAKDTDNLEITFGVDKSAGNDVQGDNCYANFKITLIQDIDQDGIGDDDDTSF